MSDIEADNQAESFESFNTEMESSSIRLTQMSNLPGDESDDEEKDPQNDQERENSPEKNTTPNKKYKEMMKALIHENTVTNPEILEYIRNTERKEILYGKSICSKEND